MNKMEDILGVPYSQILNCRIENGQLKEATIIKITQCLPLHFIDTHDIMNTCHNIFATQQESH